MTATVVVTGVSSFLGAHLALGIQNHGFEAIGVTSHPISDYSGIRKQRLDLLVDAGVDLQQLDLTDRTGIEKVVASQQPAAWIQHAGWTEAYGAFDYDLRRGFEINVEPLETLFANLKNAGCEGIILTGSSAEYTDSDSADRESDICYPTMPYGLSKLDATIRGYQLSRRFSLTTRVARIYIPVGPLDSPSKLIASVMEKLSRGERVDLTECLQRRDFLHVSDIVDGYIRLLERLPDSDGFEIYNLSSGLPVRLRDLLVMLADTMGSSASLLNFGARPMRPGEPEASFGDPGKAIKELDWHPGRIEDTITKLMSG